MGMQSRKTLLLILQKHIYKIMQATFLENLTFIILVLQGLFSVKNRTLFEG
jgi:hypothetical protein